MKIWQRWLDNERKKNCASGYCTDTVSATSSLLFIIYFISLSSFGTMIRSIFVFDKSSNWLRSKSLRVIFMFLMMRISGFLIWDNLQEPLLFDNFVEILKTRFRTSFILICFAVLPNWPLLDYRKLKNMSNLWSALKNIVYEVGRLRSWRERLPALSWRNRYEE